LQLSAKRACKKQIQILITFLPKTIPLSAVEALLKSAYTEKRSGSTIRRRENTLRDIALLELLFAT